MIDEVWRWEMTAGIILNMLLFGCIVWVIAKW